MIWRDGVAVLSDEERGSVWPIGIAFSASIDSPSGETIRYLGNFPDEQAAKAAVCYWVGAKMAKYSNALAAGYEQPDDGA